VWLIIRIDIAGDKEISIINVWCFISTFTSILQVSDFGYSTMEFIHPSNFLSQKVQLAFLFATKRIKT